MFIFTFDVHYFKLRDEKTKVITTVVSSLSPILPPWEILPKKKKKSVGIQTH